MAEFQELIKNFDRVRDYMRQFYIYGFKVRGEFQDKSPRTYDNERRRIESWLSGYTRSEYTTKGKHVYINVDSKAISQNPLFAAWKSKSFTDNDLMLHFFIPDQLHRFREGMNASQLCDAMSLDYGVVFDSQTVRLKLKEYEGLGFLCSEKSGRSLVYKLLPPAHIEQSRSILWSRLMDAVEFFQGAAPFGFIGSTVLDRENRGNRLFQFKHHFIVHTLEDGILAEVLQAIHEGRMIRYENKSSRSKQTSTHTCVPLKIFVSTQTGRRYLCLYLPASRRFGCARLDSIQRVHVLEPYHDFHKARLNLHKNMGKCWGVSFGGSRSRLEEVCLKIYIDEKKEPFILDRLYREKRGGQVMGLGENQYLFTGTFFDTQEMLSWIKTFTGRIMDIQGTNEFAVGKITRDWERMYEMYGLGNGKEGTGWDNRRNLLEGHMGPGGHLELTTACAELTAVHPDPAAAHSELTAPHSDPAAAHSQLTEEHIEPGVNHTKLEAAKLPAAQPDLFDKVYCCYYNILRHMLTEASSRPITLQIMEELCRSYGFGESALSILPKIQDNTWSLFHKHSPQPGLYSPCQTGHGHSHEYAHHTYTSRLHTPPPVLPLTLLQKSWLRSLLSDPRLPLFLEPGEQKELERCLEQVDPLYDTRDFHYFDRYGDRDPYDLPEYRKHFKTILDAIRGRRLLTVSYEGKAKRIHTFEVAPSRLQYSSKDDKFRLCCLRYSHGHFCLDTLLNLGRVKECSLSPSHIPNRTGNIGSLPPKPTKKPVLLEINGERNSLERCMLHFANYEKHTEYNEDHGRWLCSIYYDPEDETGLLMEILSFGPVVCVTGPESFVNQIRRRVKRQHQLFYGTFHNTP